MPAENPSGALGGQKYGQVYTKRFRAFIEVHPQKSNQLAYLPWEPKTFIFWGLWPIYCGFKTLHFSMGSWGPRVCGFLGSWRFQVPGLLASCRFRRKNSRLAKKCKNRMGYPRADELTLSPENWRLEDEFPFFLGGGGPFSGVNSLQVSGKLGWPEVF